MKWLVRILIPLIVLGGCIFGDIKLAKWIFSILLSYPWTVGLIIFVTVIEGGIIWIVYKMLRMW